MQIGSEAFPLFSNFYLDGEAAFVDSIALDENPYVVGDDAAVAWRAGWLAASHAATIAVGIGAVGISALPAAG
jgi:hypothetical protein